MSHTKPVAEQDNQSFIQRNSYWTLGASAICAAPAIEMALRAIVNIGQKLGGNTDPKLMQSLSKNVGGAIFYGLSAVNPIPGLAKIGALGFSGYILCANLNEPDAYFTAKLAFRVIDPIGKHIIEPVIRNIWKVVSAILSAISLPKEPIWWGVTALVVSIATYKFGSPVIGAIGKQFGIVSESSKNADGTSKTQMHLTLIIFQFWRLFIKPPVKLLILKGEKKIMASYLNYVVDYHFQDQAATKFKAACQ